MPVPVVVEQQLLWLVCLAFYVTDNIYLLKDRELLIHENPAGSWAAKFARVPFELNGKHVYFANPLTPWSLVLRLAWLQQEPFDRRKLSSTLRVLSLLQRRVINFRFVAIVSFLNLFLMGPCLTTFVGIGHALLTVALIHFALIAWTISTIWKHKVFLGLTTIEIMLLVPEYIFCPAHMVNIVRNIGWRFRQLHADGGAFGCEYTNNPNRTDFRDAMKFRLGEMIERTDAESSELAAIKGYQAELSL